MKKTAALSVVLALLLAAPALARTRHHQHPAPQTYGHVQAPYGAPTYANEIPFAPF
jgi:hypothetical protein